MAVEQLRGGDPGTASSREELSVLRGVAEELGLLGGAEAVRNFASAFGVKQVNEGSFNIRTLACNCCCVVLLRQGVVRGGGGLSCCF